MREEGGREERYGSGKKGRIEREEEGRGEEYGIGEIMGERSVRSERYEING